MRFESPGNLKKSDETPVRIVSGRMKTLDGDIGNLVISLEFGGKQHPSTQRGNRWELRLEVRLSPDRAVNKGR